LTTNDKDHKASVRAREILKDVESKYYSKFLPCIYSKSYYKKIFKNNGKYLRFWESSQGKIVIFHPPPPKIKENPTAKPERLGKVIKRLAWYNNQNLYHKIEVANEVIGTLLSATDKIAIAFSGGRDSLVAMHLALAAKPDIPVMFINTGIEFPESVAYIRELAKNWNFNFHEVKPNGDFWRITEEKGIPVGGRGNTTFMNRLSEESGVKLSNSCCKHLKEKPVRQFFKKHGLEGMITGLRIEESLMRKLNFADYGALRYSSDYNALVCWPLYSWTEADISRYLEQNDLPINPIYEMGYRRLGCWPCLQDMFYKDSRLFILQQQHPKLYKIIRKKFGKQMMDLLCAWAGLDRSCYEEKNFDNLYKPCCFEMLEISHKITQKRVGRKN
jgi:phosphoadenosine phosphosulfate reductase